MQRVEMRAGEGAGLPGYDGRVETLRRTPFVPDGMSVWEMGVGGDPAAKANSDYTSRTEDPLDVDRLSTTFVFVTARRWPQKSDWAAKRQREGKWRDVWALDADDIEQALDECPAVHIWLSEMLGMPAAEVQSLEDWWDRFAGVYEPVLTPQLVLAGRADEAASLMRMLSRETGRTMLRAASVDDGLAFVGAVMLSAEAETSATLLSKSLLVHDGPSLRRLDSTSSLLILLPYEERLRREADLVRNHHIVCIVTDGGGVDLELPPLPHLAVEAELREAGVVEADLAALSRAANKSLVALRRVMNGGARREPEYWTGELEDQPMRRAWLAGSWNSMKSGDVDVITDLTGTSFESLEEKLRRSARQSDPLFSFIGGTCKVTAQRDSWAVARVLISDSDLSRFERSIQTVLGAVDPRVELPAAERWSAAVYGTVPVHSSYLRKGIANSIALLGSQGDEIRLNSGRSGRVWAEFVIRQLLDRANEDESCHLWASLEDVMPLLAEAAPDVFLRAVSIATAGPAPLFRELFQDREAAGFAVSSPHVGLLWALETLAWSPTYFGLSAELLAVLVELDPGGRLSNRPLASLVGAFRPWFPQTSASLAARLSSLDGLVERHPDTGWNLLVALLPELHGVAVPSRKPEFRDWAPETQADVSADEYGQVVDFASRRLMSMVQAEPTRWLGLVSVFYRLPPAVRDTALDALSRLDRVRMPDETKSEIWEAVQTLARHHRAYADSDWALSRATIDRLEALASRFAPQGPSVANRWLFEDWRPDLPEDGPRDPATYDAELLAARVGGVRAILDADGLDAIISLVDEVKLPWAVGAALGQIGDFQLDADVISLLADSGARVQFASSFARSRLAGDPTWIDQWLPQFVDEPIVQARLLQVIENAESAWSRLEGLGSAVSDTYWGEFAPYGRGPHFPGMVAAAQQLISHARPATAIDMLSMYANDIERTDADIVTAALESFASAPGPEASRVSSYEIGQLLDVLRRIGVPDDRVASFEWQLFPILGREQRTPSLERALARDPQLFTGLVAMIFRPAFERGEPRREHDDESAARASNAFRLLREWRMIPGTQEGGQIDLDALRGWLAEARRLLEEADRLEVGVLQFGEVLARAPVETDGGFPPSAVCHVLEESPGDELLRGFAVGLYNKRGVTTRGLTDGGEQEYELARQFDGWAERIANVYPRTAGALRSVAEGYRAEGRQNDEEVQRFLEGLDR